jgi:predicted dehydrogenase
MIDAGIVGLGWWGNVLVESVQGKSDRIRLVHGVARDPATKQEIAGRRHDRHAFPAVDTLRLELEAFAEAIMGRAPYPIGDADMVATVAAFETVGA